MATTKFFEIELDGKAEFFLPAERAKLNFKVITKTNEKSLAAEAVVSTARQVESILTEQSKAAAVDHWSRTSMSESSHRPYNPVTGRNDADIEYQAEIHFEARFESFAAIGPCISRLGNLGPIETESVSWVLLEGTKASHQASLRAQAARNAYQKALEYAQALGYQKVSPFKLREGQTHAHSSSRKSGYRVTDGTESTHRNLAKDGDWEDIKDSDIFAYTPEDIKVTAVVHAEFYAE